MEIQALNAFNFTIKDDLIIAVPDDNENIISLVTGNKTILTKGDRVFIENSGWHYVNTIENEDDRFYCMTSKRNNSSMLILPLMFKSKTLILWSQNLINAFLWNEEHEDDSLFWILYKSPNSGIESENLRFDSMIKRFEKEPSYVNCTTYNNLYTLFAFNRPTDEETVNDIKLIQNSKYSFISKENKKKIYDFHDIRQQGSKLQMELEKSPILKKKLETLINTKLPDSYELRSSINEQNETFKKCLYQI
jgi:hypothetical protein